MPGAALDELKGFRLCGWGGLSAAAAAVAAAAILPAFSSQFCLWYSMMHWKIATFSCWRTAG
eukprot:scaffold2730_cov247-Pinguiococcus_pyrenoidosus.AAC.4